MKGGEGESRWGEWNEMERDDELLCVLHVVRRLVVVY